MALRFANEGIRNILLGAQMSSEFVSQLPKSIRISGPIIERDDYHILLEYKANGRWGEYEAPRANRLIVHSDDNNVQLVSRTPFFQQTAQFKPDLLIISALQMMENSPVDFEIRTQSIEQLGQDLEIIRSESSKLRVHFELASYTEERLLGVIVDNVFPYVDSFGMNEQEAANLLSFLKYGNISYVTNSSPRIATVLDEMRELIALLNATGDGRITRVHVHTLPYQIVVVKLNSAGKPIWPNSSSAMAKASLTAYRHTVSHDYFDLEIVKFPPPFSSLVCQSGYWTRLGQNFARQFISNIGENENKTSNLLWWASEVLDGGHEGWLEATILYCNRNGVHQGGANWRCWW